MTHVPAAGLAAPLRLLLVDDHALVRDGLKRILQAHDPQWSVDEASSGHEALEWLRKQSADVVIADLSMPGMSGLDLVSRVRLNYPATRVLVLTMHAEEQYALRAFKAGANGYLTKDSASTELARAVAKLAAGGSFASESLAERVIRQLSGSASPPSHDQLSNRELEVLRRLVAGQRLIDIADDLHLSIKTVSSHKTRILEKLQLPNLAALVRYGIEHQLDDVDSRPGALDQGF
ncbi:response regulator [Roseateles toxinivorans]|uniref:LuxR family two component transcriptional regulator n=1 Tax=Roseateles toxinivorans TaxID=270368 RepID=A0A4R6QNR1_9BURK|nr:response regulator transcription factor [Roseateles toxinivorans]TDP64121.1 LuxR family two component transcriptional regulator [Roseateles toxinivorans]